MRVYAVGGVASSNLTYRSRWVYHTFLHGEHHGFNRYGEKPYKRLGLVRNRRLMPEVFFPRGELFIKGAELAAKLEAFPGVDVIPALLDKVYDLPVDETGIEQTARKFPKFFGEGFEDWLEKIAVKAPRELRSIPFFEIQVPVHRLLFEKYRCNYTCHVPDYFVPYQPEVPKTNPMETCVELHRNHPIVWFNCYYVCREDVYEILRPYVSDTEQFTVIPLDIP